MPPERLRALERCCRLLLEASRVLGATTWYSEQYPKGLGPTVAGLRAPLQACGARRVEKVCFSVADGAGVTAALQESGADTVIVTGMETHVCVFQTVRDLRALGLRVHVPIDGVCSRRDDHRAAGLKLCEQVGAVTTTAETIVFDWLREAGTDAFRQLSPLIR